MNSSVCVPFTRGLLPPHARTSRKADRLNVRAQHSNTQRVIPPDVSADVVNALEEQQVPSRMLLPRTLTLFPPGFRGYWDSRAQQSELLRSVSQQQGRSTDDEAALQGSLFDSSSTEAQDTQGSADAVPLEGHLPAQQHGSPGVPATGLQAHLQAVLAEGQSILLLMQQSDSEGAQALQLVEHASHWKTVHVVIQQLQGAQQPSMEVLEAALLKLQDLGFDPLLLGVQGFKRQDWDSMGQGLSGMLAASCAAAPVSDLERAVCILEAMTYLGRPFHCRQYCDQVVEYTLRSHQKQGPGSLDQGLISRIMAACADLGYTPKQPWLEELVGTAVPLTPSMDAPSLVRFLWACSKFRVNVHGVRLHVSTKKGRSSTPLLITTSDKQPEQASDIPVPNSASSSSSRSSSSNSFSASDAAPLPSSRTSTTPPPEGAHTTTTTTTTLLDFTLSRLHHDLGFTHLTPSLAAQLLSALALLDAQPEPEFMDDCLLSLVHPGSMPGGSTHQQQPTTAPTIAPLPTATAPSTAQAQATHSPAQTQSLSPFTPRLGQTHAFKHTSMSGVLRLLFSLTRLGYQPPQEVSSAILDTLGQALQPAPQQPQQQQQPQPLPADELGRAAKWLANLQLTANTRWCQAALDALLATPGGPPLSAACRFLGALPDLIGPDNKALRPWVSRNQPTLERLTLSIGPQLKSASCQDLLDAITGFAKLRYYPGKKFLQWHQAACWQAARKFPPDMLVMIRAAYTSLGYQAEQRLSMAMDKAQRMLTKRFRFQMKQAGEAAEAAALRASTQSLQVDVKRRHAGKRKKLRLGGHQGVRIGTSRKGDGGSVGSSSGGNVGDEGQQARSQKGGSEEVEGLLGGLDV